MTTSEIYPLEHLLCKELPMTTITSKEDLTPFVGKWVVVRTNSHRIHNNDRGKMNYIVGRIDPHNFHGWEQAHNFERITKTPLDTCVLTNECIMAEIVDLQTRIAPILKMRLMTIGEKESIRIFMNRVNPGVDRGKDFDQFGFIPTVVGEQLSWSKILEL